MMQGRDEVSSESAVMRDALSALEDRALDKSPVLLYGESGVGKRRLVRWLHQRSPEAHTALVVCQLSDEPEDVCCEALTNKIHLAEMGVLFIDEIGDLPVAAQQLLLEAVQAHRLRLIASSSDDLSALVSEGAFLRPLLEVFGSPVRIPPLRERREDLPGLISAFLVEAGLPSDGISAPASEALLRYGWPENVRELKHVIIRAAHTNNKSKLKAEHLPAKLRDLS